MLYNDDIGDYSVFVGHEGVFCGYLSVQMEKFRSDSDPSIVLLLRTSSGSTFSFLTCFIISSPASSLSMCVWFLFDFSGLYMSLVVMCGCPYTSLPPELLRDRVASTLSASSQSTTHNDTKFKSCGYLRRVRHGQPCDGRLHRHVLPGSPKAIHHLFCIHLLIFLNSLRGGR